MSKYQVRGIFTDKVAFESNDRDQAQKMLDYHNCSEAPVIAYEIVENDNSIINSLKRLERAGSENSRATEKLREAAAEVAQTVCNLVVDANVIENRSARLPRGYSVVSNYHNERFQYMLKIHDQGEYLNVRCNARLSNLQKFAADIASGLLDEIAAWLEERTQQSVQAQRQLDNTFGLPSVASDEEPRA